MSPTSPLAPAGARDVLLGPLARRVLVASLLVEGLLVLLDVVFTYLDVAGHPSVGRIFNVAREESLPTWFASTQALFVGLVAAGIAATERALAAHRRTVLAWGVVAAFFVFVGVDDAAALHEKVGTFARDRLGGEDADLPTFGWQVYVLPFFALMGLFLLAFLWRRLRPLGLFRWFAAGMACWVVAVGLDAVEGVEGLFARWARSLGWRTYRVSHAWKVVEEVLEMVGTTLFGQAFLRYLAHRADGLGIVLRGPGPRDGGA